MTSDLSQHAGGQDRRARMERAVKDWVDQLIDLTGRNQLLYYRTLPRGTLELTGAAPAVLPVLLSGATVRLSQLFADRAGDAEGERGAEPANRTDDAFRRARTIHAKALALFEEKGIQTLFVAYGMATWTTTTSTSTPSAPVLLRPLTLRPRGAAETDFDVSLHGDWEINETLLHLLRTDFHTTVDAGHLHDLLTPAEPAAGIDATQVFAQFSKQVDQVPGFAIDERIVAGTFAYTKLPMVRDLRDNVDRLVAHDLVAAIAGAPDAQQALRDQAAVEIDPAVPDRTPPDDEFLILDADASQNAAINAALAEQPLIVQGPPGTGKSQTIANLITTLTARGQRVLFVAEKRAAIEAVTRRLGQAGLGDLVMDLHGGVTSKRKLAQDLAHTLDQLGSTPAVEAAYLHHRLTSARAALAGHAAALHEPRAPWGVSMFEVNQRLLALDDVPAHGPRFAGARLRDLDGDTVRSLRDELVEWATLSEAVRTRTSVWSGAVVESDHDAQEVLDLLSDLAADTVPTARARLDAVLTETGLPAPGSVDEWERTLALLEALAGTLAQVRPEVFDEDLERMAAALAPAVARHWRAMATVFDRGYRAARQAARELWVGQSAPTAVRLHAVITAAHDQARQWRAIGGQGAPRLPANLRDAAASYGDLVAKLAALSAYLVTDDLRQRRHADLDTEVAALLDDQQTLFRLPRIFELEERFARCHLQGFMQAVHEGRIPIDRMVDVFDRAWLSSIRAHVIAQDPHLANFDGALQDSAVEQFMTADRGHIDLTAQRVRRAVAEHATAVRDRHGDQNSLVAAQARRKRGHMPLRALFEKAPDVLTALRPCWTMSPLVVSQTLPATQVFDVVIFDEASQVQPADAVPALLRAPQAVVAGDRRQLPPTTFFDATVDADDDDPDGDGAGLTTGFESVLDVLDALLRSYRLTWHYRSQDERLIAFSNHAIYDGALITFPGAHRGGSLRREVVAHHPGRVVDTRSNEDEVARVVDLMVSHARQRRHETLGVIAMGQYHAGRIEHALRERITAERDPELDAFFDESAAERAFVKNLERVQGDERDAIILSVGYGRQPDGALHHRFGPLNNDGGERRLNVAVTRARRRLTLVSSFSHRDMDPSRSTAEGVALLRRYLQYVESGGTDVGDAASAPRLSPFDLDVKRHLEQAGLPVVTQHGASDLRIDFALPHRTRSGRMALAVETDGAGYRASPTTRDRDRLRQQVLERLGWRYHRIWSTDWYSDPQRETARVVSAYRHACDEIDLGWDDAAPVMTGRIDPEPPGSAAHPRGPRPEIPPGLAITEYSLGELIQIARWIRSDTLLRTEEQMLAEMMRELGFKRRGSRIIGELRRAIARA